MKFLTGFESFVGVNFWTCLFTLCNLLILYKFMKKLLFKPVKKMIDSRQQEVDDMYADANRDKQAAAQMKAEYEQKLAAASEQSAAMLKEAGADEAVLKIKSLEAFEKVADGQANTILLPSEQQGIASLATAWKEVGKDK